MQLRLLAANGHTPKLGTQYPPPGIDHQSSCRRLQQRLRSGLQARCLEVGVEHRAALPLAHGAMPSWCRRQGTTVVRYQFVTRVIEEVAVGRVRGLAPARWHLVGVGRAVAFQPIEVTHAVITEAPQRVVTDNALGFVLEVIEHGIGTVVKARSLLMASAATGVDHPTTFGAGTAACEAVGDQHIGALGASFQRGASTGRAPANDQHIAFFVPGHAVAISHLQGRQHFGAGDVIGH
ncbi:hypothetical protein D3C84_662370 [compost metagenome]